MCMSLSPTALPTIMDLPAPMTHTEGERFELVCSLTGIPAPGIRWEKDGSVFILGDGRRVTNSTGSRLRSVLEINSLALSDAGVYTCSVSNVAGNASRSARLEVRGEGLHSKWSIDGKWHPYFFLSHAHLPQPWHQHVSCTLDDIL